MIKKEYINLISSDDEFFSPEMYNSNNIDRRNKNAYTDKSKNDNLNNISIHDKAYISIENDYNNLYENTGLNTYGCYEYEKKRNETHNSISTNFHYYFNSDLNENSYDNNSYQNSNTIKIFYTSKSSQFKFFKFKSIKFFIFLNNFILLCPYIFLK